MNDNQIMERAAEILETKYKLTEAFTNAETAAKYFECRIGNKDREVFAVLYLNNANHMIKFEILFQGTINSSAVYPREVARSALLCNASSIIIGHNHPSGNPEPSESDKAITKRLQKALQLIEVDVLDHIIVGRTTLSFASKGLI